MNYEPNEGFTESKWLEEEDRLNRAMHAQIRRDKWACAAVVAFFVGYILFGLFMEIK